MHLLGLNWQLQPADGHTFNNGMRTGLPGTDDVATLPSGGKGEVTAAAHPLEITGPLRAPASWFRFSNPNLGRYAKRERKKGGRGPSPFRGAPIKSCLLFLSVSCVWLQSPELARCPLITVCIPMLSAAPGRVRSYWKASQGWAEQQQQQQLEKVLPDGESQSGEGPPLEREAVSPGRESRQA